MGRDRPRRSRSPRAAKTMAGQLREGTHEFYGDKPTGAIDPMLRIRTQRRRLLDYGRLCVSRPQPFRQCGGATSSATTALASHDAHPKGRRWQVDNLNVKGRQDQLLWSRQRRRDLHRQHQRRHWAHRCRLTKHNYWNDPNVAADLAVEPKRHHRVGRRSLSSALAPRSQSFRNWLQCRRRRCIFRTKRTQRDCSRCVCPAH